MVVLYMYNALTVVLHPVIDAIAKCISFCKRTLFLSEYKKYYLDKIYPLYKSYEMCYFCYGQTIKLINCVSWEEAQNIINLHPTRLYVKNFSNALLKHSQIGNAKHVCKTNCITLNPQFIPSKDKTKVNKKNKSDKLKNNNLW